MLDSMSYRPTEVFASDLRSRLQTLNRSSSPPSSDEETPSRPLDISRIRALLLEPHDHTLFGTTFPPSRCLLQKAQSYKYHSETDLVIKAHDHQESQHPAEQQTQPELLQKLPSQNPPETELTDSDLFFDFDIESPQEEIEPVENNDKVINANTNCPEIRRSSESSLESVTMTGPSTAFGSTSSGLYSDTDDSKNAEDLLEGGLAINPEAWLNNPGSTNLKDMLGLNSRNEDSTDESSRESDETLEGDKTTIFIGEKEKEVAHSKLSALISLLEKDREFNNSGNSRRSSTIGKHNSPPKELLNVASNDMSKKPDEPKVALGTSPANFSFLMPEKMDDRIPRENEAENEKSTLSRSHSTSIITDIKKEHSQMMLEAETPEPGSVVSSLKKDQFKTPPKNDSNEKNDDKNKYRRCSSLKSGKTPPGTPGRRKIVRFADVFGLDLADVKTFLDEIPKVPKSAFHDLKDAELSDLDSDSGSDRAFPVQPPSKVPQKQLFATGGVRQGTSSVAPTPTFSPLFSQPSGSTDFFNKLRDRKVCLESAYMSDLNTIKGIVRVVNLDFHKSVFIRYTTDEWSNTSDVHASYMSGSCDGFSDKFVFNIDISGLKGQVGRKVHFCICFSCSHNQYWDNNLGKNYSFQCFGAPTMTPVIPITTQPQRSTALPAYSAPRNAPQPNQVSAFSPSANDDPWLRFL